MDAAARLWRWSGAVYRRPGVAEACLRLQDESGADVVLLLTLVWAGCEGIAVDAAALTRLRAIAEPWQAQVVAPLRGVRRALKPRPGAEALREPIKSVELEAERAEQQHLAAALPAPAGGGQALERAAGNLRIYLRTLTPANSAIPAARMILRGVFAEAPADAIAAALTP